MPIIIGGVLEGRYRKGSKRGEQQSPQQQGGLHGNPATAHLQAPVNTALRNQCVEDILTNEYLHGREGGRGNNQQASRSVQST